jgi:hypothetical protein
MFEDLRPNVLVGKVWTQSSDTKASHQKPKGAAQKDKKPKAGVNSEF